MKNGQWPPQKGGVNNMPDLSALNSRQSLNFMWRMLVGATTSDAATHARIMNFVRLMGKAAVDYANAREEFDLFLRSDSTVLSPLLLATGHMETCLGTLIRA